MNQKYWVEDLLLENKKNYDCIIIGAGASGLFCAGELSKNGISCAIVEHNKAPGRKIFISGGGRCNFTNIYSTKKNFTSEESKFYQYALREYTSSDFIDLVEKEKIEYFEKNEGELFCKKRSEEIINLLLRRINKEKVDIFYGENIIDVIRDGEIFGVAMKSNEIQGKYLVVATGGLSMPKIGASDLGYRLAKKWNHKVVETVPALVPFILDRREMESFLDMSGVSFKVEITCNKFKRIDDVLITHRGVSGPGILQASLHWKSGDHIKLNFIYNLNWDEYIKKWREQSQDKQIKTLMCEFLPKRLVEYFLLKTKVESKKIAEMSKKSLSRLGNELRDFLIVPTSTEGFRKAEVTKGGVSTRNLDSKTMGSKLVENLFFIGEVVDVTGMLGGHNFQWAWSSSYVASAEIIRKQQATLL